MKIFTSIGGYWHFWDSRLMAICDFNAGFLFLKMDRRIKRIFSKWLLTQLESWLDVDSQFCIQIIPILNIFLNDSFALIYMIVLKVEWDIFSLNDAKQLLITRRNDISIKYYQSDNSWKLHFKWFSLQKGVFFTLVTKKLKYFVTIF